MSSLNTRKAFKKISWGTFFERLHSQPVQKAAPGMSRRAFFAGMTAVAVATHPGIAKAAYLPFTKPYWNALDYGVTGDGSTNDAAAINTLFTNANNAGAAVYFPGARTYDLSSSSLTVPDGLQVLAARTATFRRSLDPGTAGSWSTTYAAYTGAMISVGNQCEWMGGILTNTAVLGASATSITIGTGAKVFTVSAGLNIGAGNFLRIESDGAQQNHMEGTVTSYVGTTLTMSMTFAAGSGTFTDWKIYAAAIWQAPMVLHGVSKTNVHSIRVTGKWYVGPMFEGWNPPAGGSLATEFCSFRECYSENVMNRGFYQYGTVNNCLMDGCYVIGGGGVTDYGFNFNPANASGTVNSQQRNKWSNCHVESVGFQGFAISDLMFYNIVHACTVNSLTQSGNAGILVQLANTQVPQNNDIIGCTVTNCTGAGILFTGAIGASAQSCRIITCGIGLQVVNSGGSNSQECAGYDMYINNCTTGVSIAASQLNTTVSGRAFGNTTNLSDAGTATVTTQLRVV